MLSLNLTKSSFPLARRRQWWLPFLFHERQGKLPSWSILSRRLICIALLKKTSNDVGINWFYKLSRNIQKLESMNINITSIRCESSFIDGSKKHASGQQDDIWIVVPREKRRVNAEKCNSFSWEFNEREKEKSVVLDRRRYLQLFAICSFRKSDIWANVPLITFFIKNKLN